MYATQDISEAPGHALCTVDRIVVLIWKEAPAVAGIDKAYALLHTVQSRRPGEKLGFLMLIEPAATALTTIPDDVREALSAMLRDFERQLVGAAVVVDADGIRGSLIRTFISTMNLSNRFEFPSYTERRLDAAARWLIGRDAGLRVAPNELADAIHRVRARWAPRSAATR
jgi:hypothetical protein